MGCPSQVVGRVCGIRVTHDVGEARASSMPGCDSDERHLEKAACVTRREHRCSRQESAVARQWRLSTCRQRSRLRPAWSAESVAANTGHHAGGVHRHRPDEGRAEGKAEEPLLQRSDRPGGFDRLLTESGRHRPLESEASHTRLCRLVKARPRRQANHGMAARPILNTPSGGILDCTSIQPQVSMYLDRLGALNRFQRKSPRKGAQITSSPCCRI